MRGAGFYCRQATFTTLGIFRGGAFEMAFNRTLIRIYRKRCMLITVQSSDIVNCIDLTVVNVCDCL